MPYLKKKVISCADKNASMGFPVRYVGTLTQRALLFIKKKLNASVRLEHTHCIMETFGWEYHHRLFGFPNGINSNMVGSTVYYRGRKPIAMLYTYTNRSCANTTTTTHFGLGIFNNKNNHMILNMFTFIQ